MANSTVDYRAGSVSGTFRARISTHDTVHFAAQLALFLRVLFFEGWQPSNVPIKMSLEEFLQAVNEKIVTDRPVDPLRITQSVFSVVMIYVGLGDSRYSNQFCSSPGVYR